MYLDWIHNTADAKIQLSGWALASGLWPRGAIWIGRVCQCSGGCRPRHQTPEQKPYYWLYFAVLRIRIRMDPELKFRIRIQQKVKEHINKTVNSGLFVPVLWIRMDPELLPGSGSGIKVPDPELGKFKAGSGSGINHSGSTNTALLISKLNVRQTYSVEVQPKRSKFYVMRGQNSYPNTVRRSS